MALITRSLTDISRKVQGVGAASIIAPVIVGAIASQFPGLSQFCGSEIGAGIATWAVMQGQGVISTVTGYMTRDRSY